MLTALALEHAAYHNASYNRGFVMENIPKRFAIFAGLVTATCAIAGWFLSGYPKELAVSLFGTSGGLFVGLIVVNIYIDKSSRKVAAVPLALLIETAINRLHNDYFVEIANQKFGSTKFGAMITDFGEGKREAQAFSPEDRCALRDMLMHHKNGIITSVEDVDKRFSTLIDVLGWTFDAKVVAYALETKRNASELIAALNSEDPDATERMIKHWFDIDLNASATRRRLAQILEIDESLL